MNEDEIRKLCQQWVQDWHSADAERLKNLYAEDVTLYQAAVRTSLVGREHILARWRDLREMSKDGELTLRELYVEGNTAILWLHAKGTHTGRFLNYEATGRRYEFEPCLIFKFREDGKIVEHITFLDTATILRALDLISVPGARPEAA